MDLLASEAPVHCESNNYVTSEAKENGDGGKAVVLLPPAKKLRLGEEMNKLAEIVLVLSAMGMMRGGKNPTEVELELLSEARSKLAEMCKEFSPKDIVGRDAVGTVIEDLGLNGNLTDQRLGFRAPRLTISEKVVLGKRKMEEAKKHQETEGAGTPTVRDRTNPQLLSSGVVTSSSPYVSARSSASQGPPTSSVNHWHARTWSAQPRPAFTVTTTADNKVPLQNSVKVLDQSFRPFMSQTLPGTFPGTNQPRQVMNYGQTSALGNNHVEIAKIIHNVLHPRVQQNPCWTPPSREYMNKATTCQTCQATINDIEVLICDACEKGYHFKCLQANNLKGIPKSEWHCPRCVQLYYGKSFPVKYGRVMRSGNMQKMLATTIGLQFPAEKKVGTTDPDVNQPKPMVTTSCDMQNSPGFDSGESNPSVSISHSETACADANTTARFNSQSLKENLTGSNSLVPVSHLEAANATATASATPSSVTNNGLVSTGHAPIGIMGSVSTMPVANWVPANTTPCATSNTIVGAPTSAGFGLQGPTVVVTGGNSYEASGIANESALNASLGTLGQVVIGNSTSNPAVTGSDSDIANASQDATLSKSENASSES